jgi:hypothetical protein
MARRVLESEERNALANPGIREERPVEFGLCPIRFGDNLLWRKRGTCGSEHSVLLPSESPKAESPPEVRRNQQRWKENACDEQDSVRGLRRVRA